MAFTNSPLVSHVNISPNRTSPRNHEIDTITIHCVVGQSSVSSLGRRFAKESTQASSNYGIGYDGKIGMYVEECDRSWCSGGKDLNGEVIRVNGISGGDNDHRAITIEVASDATHPYAVKEAAYRSLINLVIDICIRNNIKELKWKANKKLVGDINQQNMTVHRWFALKSCPGDWLYSRMGEIADTVNEALNAVNKVESEKEETMYKVQVGKNFSSLDEAKATAKKLQESGFGCSIITETTTTFEAIETEVKEEIKEEATIKVGSKVKVKQGAKTYTGSSVASFVYNKTYTVDELKGDRAVLDKNGLCTPFNVKDLILV